MPVKGSCHCGAFRFTLAEAPAEVTRCTCSICSRRGALWAYYVPEDVSMEKPTSDTVYRWQSCTVTFHSCPRCGCTTYNESPSWVDGAPDFAHPRLAINARLLEGIDVEAIPVTVIDGRNLW